MSNLQGLPEDGYALSAMAGDLLRFADRIEAAHKREREAGADAAQICGEIGEMVGRDAACRQPVTDCHGLNTAAMLEALVMVKRLFDGRLMWQTDIRKAHEAVNAALAAPPRNCDVGTAEEQYKRHKRWCDRNNFKDCWGRRCCECVVAWSQMPYKEGGEE